MSKKLIIVESPTKAKSVSKYLNSNDYKVIASYGHIRDLLSKDGSVEPDNSFKMHWVTEDKAKKHVAEIKKSAKDADELILATDPDREGEAIAWHISEILKPDLKKKKVGRVVFHEITKNAIINAFSEPRDINKELVDAYLARRALDYLFGFTLSPLLWRKLPGARSAGRVQSVALRLIVDREIEIEKFITQEYWDVWGIFSKTKKSFKSKLIEYKKEKLEKFTVNNEKDAKSIQEDLEKKEYFISDIETKEVSRNPYAPFTTSTLQQDASYKIGFTAQKTMRVAQSLYEGVSINGEVMGLITYMRTDSTNLSEEAIKNFREFITKSYGEKYCPKSKRVYKSKVKNAQEAHEAIRPTYIDFEPGKIRSALTDDQFKLYSLIWKRAIASQMESAKYDQLTVHIQANDAMALFRASGRTLTFDGFLKVYKDTEETEEEVDELSIPPLKKDEKIDLKEVLPEQHFTQPPPRYNEASLVKKLEELGIGRPSTYASLIETLKARKYVRVEGKVFIPESIGRILIAFLTHFFNQYIEYDFTADLEQKLDDVSAGQKSWLKVMEQFWEPFHKTIEGAQGLRIKEVIDTLENEIKPAETICPQCKTGEIHLKLSKYGAFFGCSNYPECNYTSPVFKTSTKEEETQDVVERVEHDLGVDPETNELIKIKKGPYGFYLEWTGGLKATAPKEEKPKKTKKAVKDDTKEAKAPKKKKAAKDKPKRVSIPRNVDPMSVSLEQAVKLKQLPFSIGDYEGEAIMVAIGRFGPYLKYKDKNIALPKKYSLFDIDKDSAIEVIKKKLPA